MDSQKEQYGLLLNKALKLLSIRPRSEFELSSRLIPFAKANDIEGRIIEKVLGDLRGKKLVNDLDFVSWWLGQRDDFRPKGARLLKLELLRKGVKSEIIEEGLAIRAGNVSEFEQGLMLVRKKQSKYKSVPVKEQKAKLGAFLLRRGFSSDTVYQIIDTLYKKE